MQRMRYVLTILSTVMHKREHWCDALTPGVSSGRSAERARLLLGVRADDDDSGAGVLTTSSSSGSDATRSFS